MKHNINYHNVPRETFAAVEKVYDSNKEELDAYIQLLFWWNERINLVSRDVSRETVANHVRHSLLISQFHPFKKSEYIVDAGTGGGLPGMPLAIASKDKKFILNDIVTKKILAVKQMIRKQQLSNVETSDKTIAELSFNSPFLLVSKHAFKINNLLNLTRALPWKKVLLYKGLNFEKELEGIKETLTIDIYDLHKENQIPFYKDKAIVVISK